MNSVQWRGRETVCLITFEGFVAGRLADSYVYAPIFEESF
jgi:hypothetical protein